jgi:membrane-associated phospholipid phosphatase
MTGSPSDHSKRSASVSRTNLALGIGLGAAALISRQYENDRYAARMLDGSGFDTLIDIGDRWAEGTTLGLATAGMLAAAHATGNQKLESAGKDLAGSLIVTTAAVWSLKVSMNARRPNGGRYSFPSGHTAAAFAVAPVLRKHFGPVVGTSAYLLAGFAGLGRMEDRKHYLTDVLAGAAIGLVVGREATNGDGLDWVLAPSARRIGVSIRF